MNRDPRPFHRNLNTFLGRRTGALLLSGVLATTGVTISACGSGTPIEGRVVATWKSGGVPVPQYQEEDTGPVECTTVDETEEGPDGEITVTERDCAPTEERVFTGMVDTPVIYEAEINDCDTTGSNCKPTTVIIPSLFAYPPGSCYPDASACNYSSPSPSSLSLQARTLTVLALAT